MTNNEKREAAYELYVGGMSAVEIARILHVSTNTLSTWTTEGGWRLKRAEATTSKKARIELVANLIDYQLEALHEQVKTNREVDDIRPLDKGEIDALAKLFATIKGKEITWSMVVDIIREFVAYINSKDKSLAKGVIPHSDDFLLSKRDALSGQ